MSRRPFAFKSEDSFQEKIAIGAVGTRAILQILNSANHKMIELERGSMSTDIWREVKLKRLRVPDLECIKCGVRVESRAKTSLELTMSHSYSKKQDDRVWDAGLLDQDWVAIIRCTKAGSRPTDWKASNFVNVFAVKELRRTWKFAKPKDRKAASEGSEAQVTWPTRISTISGRVSSLNSHALRVVASDGTSRTLRLQSGESALIPSVALGSIVVANEQFVASVAAPVRDLICPNNRKSEDFVSDLKSKEFSVRFAAARALGHLLDTRVDDLKQMLGIETNIYVKLEIAGSMARWGESSGLEYLKVSALQSDNEIRFRTMMILGEIRNPEAAQVLREVVTDVQQHPEIRAAAAQSIGEILDSSLELNVKSLVSAFSDGDMRVKKKAYEALTSAKTAVPYLLPNLGGQDENVSAGIAACLAKLGQYSADSLLEALGDEKRRHWIIVALSMMESDVIKPRLELIKAKDHEAYSTIMTSISTPRWIRYLEN